MTVDEYRAVGRSCVDNDAWRAGYETIAPGLAAYQRDAVEVHATTRAEHRRNRHLGTGPPWRLQLHGVTATDDVRPRGPTTVTSTGRCSFVLVNSVYAHENTAA
ncbi:hypothetical protein ACGFY6_19765 [Streptomyces sp. NPDC048387]|uniref:hypothetical protein n=1 Tax=Streptomyces sp. NPDC048387 TaxID=3365542 RepID=UPI003710098B